MNSHVEITVADTGIGIKPEFLPHVFDRFRQADSSTTRTARAWAWGSRSSSTWSSSTGGRCRSTSPGEGQGATFSLQIPLTVVHRKTAARRTHPPQGHRRHRHRFQAVGPFGCDRAGDRRSGGCARSDSAGPGGMRREGHHGRHGRRGPQGGRNRTARRPGERHRHAGRRRIRAPEKGAGARACQGRAACLRSPSPPLPAPRTAHGHCEPASWSMSRSPSSPPSSSPRWQASSGEPASYRLGSEAARHDSAAPSPRRVVTDCRERRPRAVNARPSRRQSAARSAITRCPGQAGRLPAPPAWSSRPAGCGPAASLSRSARGNGRTTASLRRTVSDRAGAPSSADRTRGSAAGGRSTARPPRARAGPSKPGRASRCRGRR